MQGGSPHTREAPEDLAVFIRTAFQLKQPQWRPEGLAFNDKTLDPTQAQEREKEPGESVMRAKCCTSACTFGLLALSASEVPRLEPDEPTSFVTGRTKRIRREINLS